MNPPKIHAGKEQILKDFFGHSQFREGQETVIDHILNKQDVMAVMPTGAGKSLCYQIPSLLSDGVTLVISPLISLMKDQVNALTQMGIKAAFINSSLNPEQYSRVCRNMANGLYRLVYVAPERLESPSFLSLCQKLPIPLVAVDEAHCVSQWGQDFRPGYLRIARFLSCLPVRPTVAAFTATATDRVCEDIVRILELQHPFRIKTGFDRPNLFFTVLHVKENQKPDTVKDILKEREGQSGIIYCATRSSVEKVTSFLRKEGFPAAAYHAGMTDDERKANQEAFLYDRITVMVATNAFGMGIDKSNVSFVIHYHMPKSMEAYYQEAGRAGRDGTKADCILLYAPGDLHTNRFLIENGEPNPDLTDEEQEAVREGELLRLSRMNAYAVTSRCLRQTILHYFGEEAPDRCHACSNCCGDFATADITRESQMILSCVARTGQRFGQALIIQILKGSNSQRIRELQLNRLSTYGLMAHCSVDRLRQMIGWLVSEGYLAVTEGNYPVLHLTALSGDILKKRIPVTMKYHPIPSESGEKAAGSRENSPSSDSGKRKKEVETSRPELYRRLSDLRKELAGEQGIPPFYIFSNATLVSMCEILPTDPDSFLNVPGVGQVKLSRYGEAFLSEIRDYLRNGELTHEP